MFLRNAAIVGTMLIATAGIGATAASAQSLSDMHYYARGEIGAAWIAQNRGHWHSPGPADPRVIYDLDTNLGAVLGVAAGASFMPGVRGDLSLNYFTSRGVDGTWIATDPAGVAGPHANQETDVSAWTVMANLFVEPLMLAGVQSPVQPFLTGGLGVSFNTMDDWTRTQAGAPRPVRTFEGATETNFAWSVGGGVSASLAELFGTQTPIMLDLSYRYIDLGNVQGGSAPLPGNGAGVPIEPFNFDMTNHVVSLGLRIPFSTGN